LGGFGLPPFFCEYTTDEIVELLDKIAEVKGQE